MDFNIRKPSHILALIFMIGAILILIVYPIYTFFTGDTSTETIQQLEFSSASARLLFEVILLIFQLIFVFALFIVVPFLWYFLVNKLSLKEMFQRVKLTFEGIDKAFLWGILATICIFIALFVVGIVLTFSGVKAEDASNIPDLTSLFSIPILFVLVAVQPIGEEIFFRGFLFEKIEKSHGSIVAIIVTALLFGAAHLSYGKIITAILTFAVGIVLGFLVFKTKNLYSSITCHIAFNVTSLTLYVIGLELFG